MKLTKKLLPAIGMMLLSTCMLVTSTFAWFSTNTLVTAKDMTVTAKGDQVYLQIINPNNTKSTYSNKFSDGANQTDAYANNANANLLPVNVVKSINEPGTDADGKPTYSCTAYDGDKTMMWVKTVGQSNSNGAAAKQYDEVTVDSNGNAPEYFLRNTFKIRLDPTAGAAAATKALSVRNVSITAADETFLGCLSVLIVSSVETTTSTIPEGQTEPVKNTTVADKVGDLWQYDSSNNFKSIFTNKVLSAAPFSANDVATIDIYVFFNGDDARCTQANLAAAQNKGYSVTVEFTVA